MKNIFIILQGLQLIAFSTQNCYNEYIYSKTPIIHEGWFSNKYEYPITHADVHCTQVSLTSTAELSYFNSNNYDTHFIVSNSSINTLFASVFRQIPKTAVVNVSNNFIKNIETYAFAQLKNLRVVNLQFNNLTTIQDGLFASNKALQTLDLSYNSIFSIGNAFSANSLETLRLQYNKLHAVNFKLPTSLIYLNLSFNEINAIEKDAFFGLTSLVSLFLNDNRLKTIPIGCFKDLKTLKQLDLSHNKLTVIAFGVFSGLENMNRLNIANNSINTLTESAFSNLESLKNLSIEDNLISRINGDAITKYLKSLETVALSGNKFDCNYLTELIADLEKHEIAILKGNEFFTSNVRGIPCADIQDATADKTDYVQKQTELLQQILKSLNTTSHDNWKNAMEDFFQNNSKIAEKSEERMNKFNEAFVVEFRKLSRNFTIETREFLSVLLQNFTKASANNYEETKKGFNESFESAWQRANYDLQTALTKSFDGLKNVLQNNSNLNEMNEKLIAAFSANNNNRSDLLMDLAKFSNESNAMFQNFTEKMLKHCEENQYLWKKTYNESGQMLADMFKQLLQTLEKNISETNLNSTYIDDPPAIRLVDNETEDVIKNIYNLLLEQKNVTKAVESSHKKSWFYVDDSSFLYLLWHLATFCCIFIIMLVVICKSCVKCSSYKEKPSKSHENVSEMYDFCYNVPS